MPTKEQVRQALRNVLDPEIGRPIEDIGMLKDIVVEDGTVRVDVLITIEGCPLKDRIDRDVKMARGFYVAAAVLGLAGGGLLMWDLNAFGIQGRF